MYYRCTQAALLDWTLLLAVCWLEGWLLWQLVVCYDEGELWSYINYPLKSALEGSVVTGTHAKGRKLDWERGKEIKKGARCVTGSCRPYVVLPFGVTSASFVGLSGLTAHCTTIKGVIPNPPCKQIGETGRDEQHVGSTSPIFLFLT